MPAGRPKILKNAEEARQIIDAWLAECTRVGEGLTITGLALALGFTSRDTLYQYEKDEEFSDTIKRARLHVEHGYEKALRENNATGPIFALKNMGWTDKQDVSHSGTVEGLKPVVNLTLNGHTDKT